jgi:hypothetical protein
MDAAHRKQVETRYRTFRREQRTSTVRLMVMVVGILAVSIWWLATNLRS